jgi:hypothetical protein
VTRPDCGCDLYTFLSRLPEPQVNDFP